MITKNNVRRRGFTLIELLVVIAIIGILAAIVLASLDSARKKGRDADRISEINQLQKALALYYDANGQTYPPTLDDLATQNFINPVPVDPSNQASFIYVPYGSAADASICSGYHLGSSLEVTGNSALDNDADASGGTLCTAAGVTATADFDGSDAGQCDTGDAGAYCYDVINP